MTQAAYIDFAGKPSQLYTVIKAMMNRNSSRDTTLKPGAVTARSGNLTISSSHLKAFEQICDIPERDHLHIVYPFTLIYPYMLRLLTQRQIPLSLFGTLNTRTSIRCYAPIPRDKAYRVECFNGDIRTVEKGIELDIHSKIFGEEGLLWEITVTYLYRTTVSTDLSKEKIPVIQTLQNAQLIADWYLPAKDRFRFAWLCGDTNPIHYIKPYAKLSGFNQDFAQPIRIITKCVSELGYENIACPAKLDLFMKGPVYYKNPLLMKGISENGHHRFDLYCGSNERPCICGDLTQLN